MHNEFRDVFETLEQFRFRFPDHYFILDLETTGFSFSQDLIVDFGWGVVNDRKLVHNESTLLDWTRYDWIDQGWLRHRIDRVTQQMAEQGRVYQYPYERLYYEGEDPLEVLTAAVRLVHDYIERDEYVVGHGICKFDRNMIDGHTHRYMQGYMLPWKDTTLLDTGMIVKASQLNRPPYAGESLAAWFRRIAANRTAGVKWNLDTFCFEKFHLAERYGLSQSASHGAGPDCCTTYCLFETIRELVEILRGEKAESRERPQGTVANG